MSPAGWRRQPGDAEAACEDPIWRAPDGSVACGVPKISSIIVDDAHAAQNDTLLDNMVLSAPAEPIFLVGVALGVLIAGAIFALNMRRWRAQQRLR